ncbi:hypothetical protein ACFWAY_37805 [Rhodococcus sp. NPDC059968]|uniref:hypothetical protein n=1 Tax=Rhodococcus sp. NPDC059968 TaxID=3347017 RepID=UPI003671FA36
MGSLLPPSTTGSPFVNCGHYLAKAIETERLSLPDPDSSSTKGFPVATSQTQTSLVPHSDIDLFTDEVLANPYELYRELREIAPLVYLPKYEMYVLTRYEQVRAALDDWQTFSSAKGVGLNPSINGAMAGTIINSDPPGHTQLRNVLKERLAPRALSALRPAIEAKADKHIEGLLALGNFDAVLDLARTFPISVVLEMLGFPEEGRDELLRWGSATFNAMGPDNARSTETCRSPVRCSTGLRRSAQPTAWPLAVWRPPFTRLQPEAISHRRQLSHSWPDIQSRRSIPQLAPSEVQSGYLLSTPSSGISFARTPV